MVEAALLLAALGLGAGLVLHAKLDQLAPAAKLPSPLAETGGAGPATPTEAPPPRSTPAGQGSPTPSLSAVAQLALTEATARTGIAYAASGCGAGARCFSRAQETDGAGAAYVQLAVQGLSGAGRCYVYLDDPAGGWQVVAMACGAVDGFAPAVKSVVTVRASGSCGRVRNAAGTTSAVVRCLSNGTRITVTGAPQFGDDAIWWPVAGASTAGVIAQDLVVDPATLVPAKGQ